MDEYLKIKEYLLNFDFSTVGGVGNLLDILEDRKKLVDLSFLYGDDLSVSSSPEFVILKEKYLSVCC